MTRDNFRIEVYPKSLGNLGVVIISDRMAGYEGKAREDEYHSRCKEMAEQIRRHVDGVGSVHVAWDTLEDE